MAEHEPILVDPQPPASEPRRRLDRRRRQLEEKLGRLAARAVIDFDMIQDGDRILVACSGGKDSYVLLRLLQRMRRIAPVDFDLLALHVDQGQPGFPVHQVEEQLAATGVEFEIVHQNTYAVVKAKLRPGATTCSLCSRLRRGILYSQADRLGCSKIALGHHRDDLIETLLLNQLFTGQLKTMAPKLLSDSGRHVVIRPLAYCSESLIAEYARVLRFRPAPCTLCTNQEDLKRTMVRELVEQLATRYPRVKDSLFASLQNVRTTHLLDARLSGNGNARGDERDETVIRPASGKRGFDAGDADEPGTH